MKLRRWLVYRALPASTTVAAVAAMMLVMASQPSQAIEGGSDAARSEFPYLVQLQHNDWLSGWQHACGGVLITTKHVLTAASCIDQNVNVQTDYRVIAGELDTTIHDGSEITLKLTRAEVHPGYETGILGNNLAVLTLLNSVDFNGAHHVAPAKVPHAGQVVPTGTGAEVAGWGTTQFLGPNATHLQKATLLTIDPSECAATYGGETTITNTLCASYPGANICDGDEGTPLVAGHGTDRQLAGIASLTLPCGSDLPSVFVDIAAHADWIRTQAPDA